MAPHQGPKREGNQCRSRHVEEQDALQVATQRQPNIVEKQARRDDDTGFVQEEIGHPAEGLRGKKLAVEGESETGRSIGEGDFRSFFDINDVSRFLTSSSFSMSVNNAAMKPTTVPPSMSMSLPKSSGMRQFPYSTGCYSSHEGISPPAKFQKPTGRFSLSGLSG